MSWANKIIGYVTGNGAEVDADNNLYVTGQQVNARLGGITPKPNAVGAIRAFTENDSGALTGTAYLKSPETSCDYRLRVGMDTVLFTDTFNASTQNTNNWAYTFATLTAAQPGAGTVNFGVVQGTAATHGAFMRSYQYFPVIGTAPLAVEITVGQYTAPLVANEVWLMGLGVPGAAGTAPTDGVWFQITSAGVIGVLAYNNTTTQSGTILAFNSVSVGDIYKFTLVVGEGEIEFWSDDVFLGELAMPSANGQPFQQASLPVFLQKYCTGAVANTNTMRVSDITVSLMDLATNKPWPHQMAIQGQSGYLGQNGHTQGKTSLWGISAAPTATALVAASAAFTGLGGITAVLPTLTVGTDGQLISYQNPAPTINITGRNLIITGVTIQGAVSVILAGGPVTYAYALAFGNTATALATADTASFATATTHSPRIVPLGIENYIVTAPVGTQGTGVKVTLTTPVVVRPGEWVSIIARNIGVVTTTGAITIVVAFDAYWE